MTRLPLIHACYCGRFYKTRAALDRHWTKKHDGAESVTVNVDYKLSRVEVQA